MARAKSIDLVEQALKEVKMIIMRNHGGDDTFFRTWNAKKGIEGGKRIIFHYRDGTRRHCVCRFDCSRHRYSQHHARLGDRANTGNRIAKSPSVRKSLDIRLQFLTESILLCLMGSLLGIAFGAVVGNGFAWVVSQFFNELSWPSVITPEAVLISVAAGTMIGIFFGYYPASQAAKMTPIDAIRPYIS